MLILLHALHPVLGRSNATIWWYLAPFERIGFSMKAALYAELRQALLQDDKNTLEAVNEKYPWVEFDTVVAIKSQEASRHIRMQHHKFRSRQRIQEFIARYTAGEDILEISRTYDIPPCLLMRILLEHLAGLQKHQVSACLKDPSYLPESSILIKAQMAANRESTATVSRARFGADVFRCIDNDPVSSPAVETIRRVTGLEYEILLYEKLSDLGISYQSEDDLRAAGFSKTPDVKLDAPIGVRGRMVNWIDSKASFGDEHIHKTQGSDQFQSYVNRFGPGMVIYWFGYIDELNDNPDILLMDHFPDKSEVYCLTVLPVQPRP